MEQKVAYQPMPIVRDPSPVHPAHISPVLHTAPPVVIQTVSPQKVVNVPLVRPVWGPSVQLLKQKVKDIEEEENQLLREFSLRERQAADELERLEAAYTEKMEQIREADLQEKERVHRRHLQMRRKVLEDLKMQRDQHMTSSTNKSLERREREYRQQLEQGQAELLSQYRAQVDSLEQQLRRLKTEGIPDEGAAAKLGLELAGAPPRKVGGGVRVMKASGLALAAGIRAGDMVTNVTRALDIQSRNDVAHLLPTIKSGEQMMLTLRRGGQEVQAVLTVGRQSGA